MTGFEPAAVAAVEEAGRACQSKGAPMQIAHAGPWLAASGAGAAV